MVTFETSLADDLDAFVDEPRSREGVSDRGVQRLPGGSCLLIEARGRLMAGLKQIGMRQRERGSFRVHGARCMARSAPPRTGLVQRQKRKRLT